MENQSARYHFMESYASFHWDSKDAGGLSVMVSTGTRFYDHGAGQTVELFLLYLVHMPPCPCSLFSE